MIGIIGAGPTGLAISYLLKKRGIDFQIIERDSVGHTWKNQYETLHLNSLRDASSLPGMPMPKSYPVFPSAVQFASYLEGYAETFELPIQKAEVSGVNFKDSGFELLTDRENFHYQTVVIATGIWGRPHHPYADSSPFTGETLHASAYRTASPFKGKRVLVVGSGSTAADIAVELAGCTSFVGMSIAHGVNIVPPITSTTAFQIYRAVFENDSLFRLFLPLLVKMRKDHSSIGLPTHPLADTKIGYSVILGDSLVEAVRDGAINIFPAFTGFSACGAVFVDGREVDFDTIIFATGYKPALHFARNCFEMDADGHPVLDGFQSTRYKNIYFVCTDRDYEHNIGWLPSLERTANNVVKKIVSANHSAG